MIVFIILSYLVTKQIFKKKVIHFTSNVIKYKLKPGKLKKAIYSKLSDIGLDNTIFYTDEKINHTNYIYDIINEWYYLIEPGYYYYIKDSKNYSFNNKDIYIYYLKFKNKK